MNQMFKKKQDESKLKTNTKITKTHEQFVQGLKDFDYIEEKSYKEKQQKIRKEREEESR